MDAVINNKFMATYNNNTILLANTKLIITPF